MAYQTTTAETAYLVSIAQEYAGEASSALEQLHQLGTPRQAIDSISRTSSVLKRLGHCLDNYGSVSASVLLHATKLGSLLHALIRVCRGFQEIQQTLELGGFSNSRFQVMQMFTRSVRQVERLTGVERLWWSEFTVLTRDLGHLNDAISVITMCFETCFDEQHREKYVANRAETLNELEDLDARFRMRHPDPPETKYVEDDDRQAAEQLTRDLWDLRRNILLALESQDEILRSIKLASDAQQHCLSALSVMQEVDDPTTMSEAKLALRQIQRPLTEIADGLLHHTDTSYWYFLKEINLERLLHAIMQTSTKLAEMPKSPKTSIQPSTASDVRRSWEARFNILSCDMIHLKNAMLSISSCSNM